MDESQIIYSFPGPPDFCELIEIVLEVSCRNFSNK